MHPLRYLTEKPSERQARLTDAHRAATNYQPRRVGNAARRATLDAAVVDRVSKGATLTHRQDFEAVLRYHARVNHVVHAILSLLTVGVWLLVWLPIAFYTRPYLTILSVDEYGEVAEVRTTS